MFRSITQSVGRAGVNRPEDVKTIQDLLNAHLSQIPPARPLTVDGRPGPLTFAAIEDFQRRVVGLAIPDGRVDPNGRTLAALNQGTQPPISLPGTFRVLFRHGGKMPPDSSATKGTDALYESAVTVSGPKAGTFRGSIFPDDMSVKGRIKDGTYDLYLGFHKRAGHTPTAADLVVRSEGFRAALVVNADRPVPVVSNNPAKTTSETIHVHNGFVSKRFSDGCPTIHPTDWPAFIKLFLEAFPVFADWSGPQRYLGKKAGTLEVQS